MSNIRELRIHGDNIVECERIISLIKQSIDDLIISFTGPHESPVCPLYKFQLNGEISSLNIRFFPGFGRWNVNIMDKIKERGGVLREAADVVITEINKETKKEIPLIAIEFCGALPAGNQAWQRSGRA